MQPQQSDPQSTQNQEIVPQVAPVRPLQNQPQIYAGSDSTNFSTPPIKNTRKRVPTWIKVIGIVLVLVVILFVVLVVTLNQSTKAAVQVSTQFIADIKANNTDGSYALTSTAFQQTTTKAAWEQDVSNVAPMIKDAIPKIISKSISKLSGSASEASIGYSLTTKNAVEYAQVVLQDNSSWQVTDFKTSSSPLNTTPSN